MDRDHILHQLGGITSLSSPGSIVSMPIELVEAVIAALEPTDQISHPPHKVVIWDQVLSGPHEDDQFRVPVSAVLDGFPLCMTTCKIEATPGNQYTLEIELLAASIEHKDLP